MPNVYPYHVPRPRSMLCWDGVAYRAVACDGDGRVQVRGEDQLFSFKGVLADAVSGNPSGANGYIESGAVPAGELWVVENVLVRDATTALTEVYWILRHDGADYAYDADRRAIAVGERVVSHARMYMDSGDTIRAYMTGCLAADNCSIRMTGHRMTAET